MKLKRDNSNLMEARGLTRYRIDCYSELKAGKVTQRYFRKDDDGQPFANKQSALDYMEKLAERIDAGSEAVTGASFRDAFNVWASEERAAAKNGDKDSTTANKNIANAERHILGKWTLRRVPIGNVRLDTITHDLLHQEIINNGQLHDLTKTKRGTETPLSHRSKTDLLRMFKAIFETVSGDPKTWIPRNPAAKLKQPRNRAQETAKAINPKVYRRLADNCPAILAAVSVIRPDLELPFRGLRLPGLRPQELRALTPDDIERNDGVFELNIVKAIKVETQGTGPTKNQKSRYVPISESLAAELQAHAASEGVKPHQPLFGELDEDAATGALTRKPLNHHTLILVFEQAQLAVFGYRWTTANTSGRNSRLVALKKSIADHTHDEWLALEFEFTRGRVIDLDPEVITARRSELGLTAKALAAELGVSDRTWGFVDRGARGAKRELAERAAEILGVDLETLAAGPVPEQIEVSQYGSVEDVAEALEVEMHTPYSLRHLYASTLFDNGHTLREIAELLGDREETTSKYYIHFMKRDRSKAQAILDSIQLVPVAAISAPALAVAA